MTVYSIKKHTRKRPQLYCRPMPCCLGPKKLLQTNCKFGWKRYFYRIINFWHPFFNRILLKSPDLHTVKSHHWNTLYTLVNAFYPKLTWQLVCPWCRRYKHAFRKINDYHTRNNKSTRLFKEYSYWWQSNQGNTYQGLFIDLIPLNAEI